MRFSKFRFKWWLRWWPRYAKYLWSLLTRSALVINRSQRFSMRLRRSPSRSTLVMPTETADVTTTSETATTSELGITETQATRSNNSSATMQKCINTQISGGSFFYLEPKQCHCTDQVWVNPYVNSIDVLVYWCVLMYWYIDVYWCIGILMHMPYAYWCKLLQTDAHSCILMILYWCILMCIDVYWCVLMYIDVYWCIM